jgi:poly(3-hydroxyoctanoate) depolymerase
LKTIRHEPFRRRHGDGLPGERVIRVGSHRVPVSVKGEDDGTIPLLMCNGVGAEYQLWGDFRDHLLRTTVTFDVRGEYLGRRPSLRTYAAFVREVLDKLEYETVDVVGLSWGGMAAQQLVHDHPESVRRLVLASTTPGFVSLPAKPSSTLALLSPRRDAARMPAVMAKVYGGDFTHNPDLAAQLGLIRPVDKRTYRRQMWAVLGWTSVAWLRTLRSPTLILHGDDDPVIPLVNSRLMRSLIPDASLTVVPGGGHLFLYTRPEEFGRQVTDFLTNDIGPRSSITRRPEHRTPTEDD